MAATEQKALWPDEINIKPQTAKSTATQESEHQLSRASEPEIQLRRRELDTATAYASDVRMMVSRHSSVLLLCTLTTEAIG